MDINGALPSVVVLNTAHPEYTHVDFLQWRERGVRIVVDGRNFWNPSEVQQAGLCYIAPGFAVQHKEAAVLS